MISGALLQSRGAQQQLETTQLEHNIGETVAAANQILAPFVGVESGTSSEKRLRNLESLVRRAAQLALLLFSQPSSWDLDWKSGAVGIPQDSIVVFPGLMETVNEEGVALQPPRQFHQTEVIAVL